jgi:hypothetical protein
MHVFWLGLGSCRSVPRFPVFFRSAPLGRKAYRYRVRAARHRTAADMLAQRDGNSHSPALVQLSDCFGSRVRLVWSLSVKPLALFRTMPPRCRPPTECEQAGTAWQLLSLPLCF